MLEMARARACGSASFLWGVLPLVLLIALVIPATAHPSLTTSFYDERCPKLQNTVKEAVFKEMLSDWRIGASMMRIMFHDCFVQGCDASILLDDTPTFTGEKQSKASNNSLRKEAFDAFDNVKAAVEKVCPGVVSCADILVLVARDAVVAAGGPSWAVQLGRRDSLTASLKAANSDLPLATMTLKSLIQKFLAKGLSPVDLVALSGAHTFGKARCPTFRGRLYDFNDGSGPDPTLDTAYLATLQKECPQGGSNTTTVYLDQATPYHFDNAYYSNLLINRGLLNSDQILQDDSPVTDASVKTFATNENRFFAQFTSSMVKMGAISPLVGAAGEIRSHCRMVNSAW